MNCKYCGSDRLQLKGKTNDLLNENQVALVCCDCGKWLKWIGKNEREQYLQEDEQQPYLPDELVINGVKYVKSKEVK